MYRTRLRLALASVAFACSDVGPQRAIPDRVLWRVPVPESPTRDPAFANGVVYFASHAEHALYAIDGLTGHVVWKTVAPDDALSIVGRNLVVAGSMVAGGSVDVFGFDRATGQWRWVYRGEPGDEPGRFRLAADAQTVYAATFAGRAHALDAQTGAVRWTVDLAGRRGTSAFDPTVSGDELYVGTKNFDNPATGSFFALDARTGRIRWRYDFTPETPGRFSGCLGGAIVAGDVVVVAQEDGRVFAFRRTDGTVKWISPAVRTVNGADQRYFVATPLGILATTIDGTVSLINANDGTVLWHTRRYNASITSVPATDGTYAYVSHGGLFVIYRLSTGEPVWTDPAVPASEVSEFWGSPIVDGDRVYVPGFTGFYALRRQ